MHSRRATGATFGLPVRLAIVVSLLVGLFGTGVVTPQPAAAVGGALSGPFAGKFYGSFAPKIGANGNLVVYASWLRNFDSSAPLFDLGVYYRDRPASTTEAAVRPMTGSTPNGTSWPLAVSPDAGASRILYRSTASNLVPGDTLGHQDIFLFNRVAGATERVSLTDAGGEANGPSTFGAISGNTSTGDPRYVAFMSAASNLVAGDNNGRTDIFVRDRVAGTTRLASVGMGGTSANGDSLGVSISDNGRFVAFASTASNLVANDTNNTVDIFVRDMVAGTTQRVSVGFGGEASGASAVPNISADGRFVSFDSDADNLVPLDENFSTDVFVHDRLTGWTERVSVGSSGEEGFFDSANPSMTRDGRYIAFETDSEEFDLNDGNISVDVYVRDRTARTTQRASVRGNGLDAFADSWDPSISPEGRFVGFFSDTDEFCNGCDNNDDDDVYLKDMGASFMNQPQGSRFRALTPRRVLDTTTGAKLTAGATPEVQVTGGSTTVPTTATAVALNIRTSATTGSGGELTVYPSGITKPTAAALHTQVATDVANQIVVKVGTGGKVRLHASAGATHLTIDVVGYYAPDDGDPFTAVTAPPIVDTRGPLVPAGWPAGQPLVSVPAFTRMDIPVAGVAKADPDEPPDVPADARAVVLAITSHGLPAKATVTAFPTGTSDPGTPNVVLPGTGFVTNNVVAAIGADGKVSLAVKTGAAHVIVSVAGYYGPSGTDIFFPLDPARAFDTRSGSGSLSVPGLSGPLGAASSMQLSMHNRAAIPANARAVAVVLSSTSIATPGLLLVGPVVDPPTFRLSLMYWPNTVSAGNVLPLGEDGGIRGVNYASSSVHLFAEAYGYFR